MNECWIEWRETMSYQSEHALEEEVMLQLNNLGYERVKIHNTEQLENNFRQILNERNADRLMGEPLSDTEFKRLMVDISDKSVFDSAMKLRDKYELVRDDSTIAYLEFFNKEKWCQNKFQVTNQVTVKDKHKSRYDVTILINGLPLVQIELKRSGVAITEAFNQVERYQRYNYTGLFKYIQILVISNKLQTRYLANSDKQLLKSHMFYWTDKENERITHLRDFIDDFLEPCQIAKMISRYMVINQTEGILMALRPYQVYAVEEILNQATETNNNGYIWHTTGSGKTLTSFKVSQLLAEKDDIKKVIFLVDRQDLDSQTISEFNKFDKGSVDTTENTRTLLKQLGSDENKLIVTTMQKMAKAVNSGNKVMDRYETDKVIFIIDECHRSQFGSMHGDVKKHFKNAQYFGFTGTPRFEVNKSQDGRSTADIFGRCLHHYLIKDAIRDNNVLGFSVDYVKVAHLKKHMNDGEVKDIDRPEYYGYKERHEIIVDDIIENYKKKTYDGKYTSIFTVDSIERAMEYFRVFKEKEEAGEHNLKVSSIFTSSDPNEDTKEKEDHVYVRDELEYVMKDYNQKFGTNFDTYNYAGYFSDVSKRMKKVIPGEKIDILIVVNIFLTGFDSKLLNTLYVDRNLYHHGLIQAFSRTNRVEKETKPYGNIVCYRNLKANTDKAIEIFSKTDNTDVVLSPPYHVLLQCFQKALAAVYDIAPLAETIQQLERDEDKEKFVKAFRDLTFLLVKIKPFPEFEFTLDEIGIDHQEYEDYLGQYKEIYRQVQLRKQQREENAGEKASILEDIDFSIELMRNDVINVDYILDLLARINLKDKRAQQEDTDEIRKLLDKADDEHLRLKSDLIREFLDDVIPTLSADADIREMYYRFEERKKREEIKSFAIAKAFSAKLLERFINEYEYSGQINKSEIDKETKGSLLLRNKTVNQIATFIKNTVNKFTSIS